MRRLWKVLLTLTVTLFLLAAGLMFAKGAREAQGATSAQSAPNRQLLFVMVPKGVHPYFEPVYRGFTDAAARYGVLSEVDAPPRFDVGLQVKVIKDLIARGVSGIAISANDDKGLVSVIQEATQSGIKVITFDAPAPSSEALTYIGTDNESAGYEAGKRMATAMANRGSIAVLQGGLDATNLNLRTRGFRRALSEAAPHIRLVGVIDEGGDFSESVHKAETLLIEHPDLRAIFSVSAEGAPAAAAVVKREGRAGKVLVAGFDDLGDTLQGIRDGSIVFCVVQNTYKMGWLSVERLLDAVANRPLPRFIDTGVVFVDRKNIDAYKGMMEADNNRQL
ncbi:MAG TPA: sugar-binding protein [Spirochaetia bacterium]|nr:sugar-binding protein [Spirochaetia bacterium]